MLSAFLNRRSRLNTKCPLIHKTVTLWKIKLKAGLIILEISNKIDTISFEMEDKILGITEAI